MSADPDNIASRWHPRIVRGLVSAALIVTLAGTATPAAAEFEFDPYVSGGARYDTNPRYLASNVPFDIESAWGTIIDARVPMEYRTQRAQISLDPRIVYSFYPDDEYDDLEDRDNYLIGDASWISQRSNVGASYGYTDLSLRTSEFQNAGGSTGGSGEGRVFFQDKQRRWYFQPYWQYQFSQANSFLLNAGYEEVRYDEDILSRRYDYDYSYTSITLDHAINSRHSLGLRAQWTKFDSENRELRVQNDSETNSASVVYQFAWSATTLLSADLGWARTKNKVRRPNSFDPIQQEPICDPVLIPIIPCQFESDSTNFVGNVTLAKNTEKTQYKLLIGQSITPNSNGAEVLRFNIDATARHEFTERVFGRLGIAAFTQDDVGDSTRNFERDYIRVRIRMNYRFAKDWSIYGAYVHTFNDQNDNFFGERTVRNNFLSVGITFASDGWRW